MNGQQNYVEKIAIALVALMALLQAFYAFYAFFEPAGFAALRGTGLVSTGDIDWVKIYASRTFFIALIIGLLVYRKNYKILMWAALFGTVMPITDGFLAYEAQAASRVILKHAATAIYLLGTALTLRTVVNKLD